MYSAKTVDLLVVTRSKPSFYIRLLKILTLDYITENRCKTPYCLLFISDFVKNVCYSFGGPSFENVQNSQILKSELSMDMGNQGSFIRIQFQKTMTSSVLF